MTGRIRAVKPAAASRIAPVPAVPSSIGRHVAFGAPIDFLERLAGRGVLSVELGLDLPELFHLVLAEVELVTMQEDGSDRGGRNEGRRCGRRPLRSLGTPAEEDDHEDPGCQGLRSTGLPSVRAVSIQRKRS